MIIKDLKDKYPLVYEAAIKNCNTGCNENNTISGSFTWSNTPEDHNFWWKIEYGRFDEAKKICPRLFTESPEEFKVGDWVYAEKQDEKDYRNPKYIPVFQVKDFNSTNEYLRPVESSCSGVHMKHCRKATQAEIDKATGAKSDSFVLPEKWCVAVTDANTSILNSWRKTKDADMNVELSCWLVSDAWDDNSWCSYTSTLPNRYTEITFEQFKQHVLKGTTIKDKEPIIEEYPYKVGDTVVVKSYKQAGEGNDIITDNLLTVLLDKNRRSELKPSGMVEKNTDFIVKEGNFYYGIKKEHIIRKAWMYEVIQNDVKPVMVGFQSLFEKADVSSIVERPKLKVISVDSEVKIKVNYKPQIKIS